MNGLLPAGFDPTIWGYSPVINGGYPYLLWQTQTQSPPPSETVFTPPFAVPPPDLPRDVSGRQQDLGYIPWTGGNPLPTIEIPNWTGVLAGKNGPPPGFSLVSVTGITEAPYSQPRGTLVLKNTDGKTLTLDSISNGDYQGTKSGEYQCTELIVRYAQSLGIAAVKSTANTGDGKDAAENFARLSSGAFSYVAGAGATTLPTVGSVISFSAWPGDSAGHVGIVQSIAQLSATQFVVTLFDQNLRGAAWKTVTFTKQGNVWQGTMIIHNADGTSINVPADGWANPVVSKAGSV
jgi:hypothetical protein